MSDEKINYKKEIKKLQLELGELQRRVKAIGFPVLIIFEGWESSGRGTLINNLIREMDPRTFKVKVYEKETETEKRKPFLWRFWQGIPPKGDIHIFAHSYYQKVFGMEAVGKSIKENDLEDIMLFEKQLADDGTLVIKFFLDISKETLSDRVNELSSNEYTAFRVSELDWAQIKHWKEYKHRFDEVLRETSNAQSPWHIVNTEKKRKPTYEMLSIVKASIEERLNSYELMTPPSVMPTEEPNTDMLSEHFHDEDLNKSISDEDYKEKLPKLQKEAKELAYALYTKKIPTIMVFEGWDAAGKGGAIKRLTKRMDPRGYEVFPISAPDETEKKYNYMWRFYKGIPKTGHIAIFDRSWYGRVLVERVEGFASFEEVERAYDEINGNEKHFVNSGAIVLKFFIDITPKEQLARFEARQEDPTKNYKITDEDWRNREKWDEYLQAIDKMFVKTHTDFAPWILVEGNDKKFARIKVLEAFVFHAKKRLRED